MHLLSRRASDLESQSVMNVKLDRLAVSVLECSLLLHLSCDFVLCMAKGKDVSGSGSEGDRLKDAFENFRVFQVSSL